MLNEIKDWGGGEVLTLDLAVALRRFGIDVFLGCNREAVILERAKSADIPVIPFYMQNEIDIFAVIYIVNLIYKYKFNIVHCHTMRDHVLGGLAAKYYGGVPVVRTQHIHYPENPSFMAQLAYRKWTDLIICNSNFIKENLEKAGVNPELLRVVHNGIDFNRMKGSPCFERNDSLENIRIGCVGSLFATKGHEYLIKAFPKVIEKFPGSKLIIVGDGQERQKLESLAYSLGIKKKVEFMGECRDIPEILSQWDIAVVPSVWNEPFGLVCVEAMYAGIPLVATKVGGIPEIVEDGVTGILVPPKDDDAIAKAIINLLENRNLRETLAANARKRVQDHFSADRMAKDVINIYEQLLSKRPVVKHPTFVCHL